MFLFTLGVYFDILIGAFIFTGALCVTIHYLRGQKARSYSLDDGGLPLSQLNSDERWSGQEGEEEEHKPLLVELLPSDGSGITRQPEGQPTTNVTGPARTDRIFAWGSNSDESSDDDWDFEIEAKTVAAIEQRVKAIGAPDAWALIKECHVGDFMGGVYCPCRCCRHRTAFKNQSALLQHMKTISYSRGEHQAWVKTLPMPQVRI
mmetsp:Transcript_25726/g.55873  ORF Transcript_25726/g.55873 Transcript_25726/m.55873 type:complete len:205 (-) Transcript_25726:1165-1779(-)